MLCAAIQQLYQLCRSQQLGVSSTDLIRLACTHCHSTEVCPAVNGDEYDARNQERKSKVQNVKN